ncbi:hypothetical protein HNR24_000784 [Nesterenkonia jeotgali]|uniref:Uncharacterized protein n=1 Tax=Nesterenkonia jeotgali TaxID=317018 RepID=A0A839FQF2_9MICC|nr:hypothetical protein [Nesterenkonia jeotgali]
MDSHSGKACITSHRNSHPPAKFATSVPPQSLPSRPMPPSCAAPGSCESRTRDGTVYRLSGLIGSQAYRMLSGVGCRGFLPGVTATSDSR